MAAVDGDADDARVLEGVSVFLAAAGEPGHQLGGGGDAVILFEAALSFLGLGIAPPTPSWGNMLTDAQELVWTDPALTLYPGLFIFATVIAFNFLGDGLQDALDPRAKARVVT